jgi:starch synthase
MKILMAGSEAAPYAKTGGLADVLGSLPAALAARGEQVAVVIPLYAQTAPKVGNADRVYDRMPVWLNPDVNYSVDIRRIVSDGVTYFFIDCPALFDRPALYGEDNEDYPDNHVRFAVFCRGVLGIMRSLFRPDIVHCHDWQAGLVGPYMRRQFRLDPTFIGLKMLMTIHNLGYPGLFPRGAVAEMGLSKDVLRPDDPLEYWGKANLLKGGLLCADAISTVSPTYAEEIKTDEQGMGHQLILRERAAKLTGILNGVDYREWNPETDPLIAANYSAEKLSGKPECKRDLLAALGLPPENQNRPVIGIVARFVDQKGFDLIEQIAGAMMQENLCLVALGTGDPKYEQVMADIASTWPDRAAVRIEYNNELAHKIEAGADIFLMPSRYEPCGLNQMYSLRYGTVPVVRATGGLNDTIDEETGFKFHEYSGTALLAAVRAALAAWRDAKRWPVLIKNGMRRDYSWDHSAGEYMALYRRLAPGP